MLVPRLDALVCAVPSTRGLYKEPPEAHLHEVRQGRGENDMMINIDPSMLDGLVRAWLKETLEILEGNFNAGYIHPDDHKTYKKDIKAVKQLLDYVGE